MTESPKSNIDWRGQIAAITGQVSGLELKFGLLYESIQPLLASLDGRSAVFQKPLLPQMPENVLKNWAEVRMGALQASFQTPALQDLCKQLAEWQSSGPSAVFKAPEYQSLLARIAESPKTLTSGILPLIGPALAQFQSTAWQESWAKLSKVVADSMKATHDALERVELLAALGWTLPMEMSPQEFHALVMQDDLTPEAADEWFLDYYSRDEAAEFASLKDHLLESDHLAFWKPLLEQVFDAFSRGQFAVCVPSLLSVLEGSIAIPWGVTAFHKERCRKEFFEERVRAARPDSIHQFQWKSLAAFVQTVFEGVDPNREYPIPKRNLILHGKSDPAKWDRADCLRVFQAIDTILSLGGDLSEDPETPTVNGSAR